MSDFGRMFDLDGARNVPSPSELGATMGENVKSAPDRDNTIPAGYTVLGQFVAHDIVGTAQSTLVDEAVPVDRLYLNANPT